MGYTCPKGKGQVLGVAHSTEKVLGAVVVVYAKNG